MAQFTLQQQVFHTVSMGRLKCFKPLQKCRLDEVKDQTDVRFEAKEPSLQI